LPGLRRPDAGRARRRGRQHLQARHRLRRGGRRLLPGPGREAQARRDGLLREEHRDEDGLVWPASVAPYHMHLVASDHDAAPSLYEGLASAGIEVLYDDRRESLGTKFKDADLIGAPIRLTLTPRSLNSGGVEMKLRRERGSRIVPVDEAVGVVQQRLSELEAELLGTDSRR
jgi:prolyl-tRNA synthetase